MEDAGQAATECDVLVCKSVIGAGFSVYRRHIPSILDHQEEQQFIQRLRVKLDDTLREGVSRNCFMFVEKGHGNGMSEYFAAIELGPGLRLFRALASTEQSCTLELAFQFPKLVTNLIELKFPEKK